MKTRLLLVSLAAAALCAAGTAAEDKSSKIGEVMKSAFKGDTSLIKKASKGEASAEELKQLVAYCESLAKEKPSQGDEAGWKTKTEALVKAAKALEGGGKDGKALGEAANCKACHDPYKPKK